ncbi:hypothetical protein EPI10_028300 [Gossypium australe]|uniref:Uncharacterized protein n=1 Tax=Gossypium australe TaxID=47621 RepID=A0A5B6UYV3_9ROSI|nr:hypothetical protein EPI10_028300 [Gossypium australe]
MAAARRRPWWPKNEKSPIFWLFDSLARKMPSFIGGGSPRPPTAAKREKGTEMSDAWRWHATVVARVAVYGDSELNNIMIVLIPKVLNPEGFA